jgi:hypothetical protein
VLIDEYLTSQMCHDCHNKMVPHKGDSQKKYCSHCGCDVDRDVNAAKNMLEPWRCFCSMFVDGGVLSTCTAQISKLSKCRCQQQLCPKQLKCDCVTEPVPCLWCKFY